MVRQISQQRKAAYYVGMILIAVGALFFASTFVSFIANFGNAKYFKANATSMPARAFGGMALMIIGGIIRTIGARGVAGSGLILDPHQARQDLEPYTRMAGGMVKDVLDEADIELNGKSSEKIIMIKCKNCGKLNEEDSRFCQECGKPL